MATSYILESDFQLLSTPHPSTDFYRFRGYLCQEAPDWVWGNTCCLWPSLEPSFKVKQRGHIGYILYYYGIDGVKLFSFELRISFEDCLKFCLGIYTMNVFYQNNICYKVYLIHLDTTVISQLLSFHKSYKVCLALEVNSNAYYH